MSSPVFNCFQRPWISMLGFFSSFLLTECPTGTYGNNCKQTCPTNCLIQDCNRFNGKCIGGCKPGFESELCDQKCSPTMYGINCSRYCDERNCYGSDYTECNHITGNCTEGCKPGFRDVDCSKLCTEGLYGKDCSNMCTDRNCLQNQNCDQMNGICIDGCKPGFISIDCTQVCDEGYYGLNCSKKCSDRNCIKNSTICNNEDGSCVGGCLDGYRDLDCRRFNAQPEDNETSIIIGVLVGIIIILVAIIVGVCVYFRKRTSSRSPTIKDPPVVYDVITSSNNSNSATPEAQIYMIDLEENDLPEQSNVNHYNSLRAAYVNENPYEQITK